MSVNQLDTNDSPHPDWRTLAKPPGVWYLCMEMQDVPVARLADSHPKRARMMTHHAHNRPNDPAIDDLLTQLAHVGKLTHEAVKIPGSHRVVEVTRPVDIETLLDQSADDPEQNLPYWAEIWPSGIALAAAVAANPERVAGLPVLELGSGVGITAAIALEAGAILTTTDYAPESNILTRLTCQRYTGRQPVTRQVNWRSPDADLLQEDGSPWPVVLAADVLYEERDIEPILDVFQRVLSPGGLLWLAEPGRRPARLAVDRARERGWSVRTATCDGDWPDPKDDGVIVNIHEIRPGARGTD
jgi:predicted nicotinamide N-methyase